ncbi:MAG: DNA mismatch repair endonuclease MutL, partial [Elusimicrobia bacterium]|nr:DNA mismatch repair endonuclease MutL [Elusimicrobiota bacterium]
MTVHKLPEDLISRIAAGEVVERPAAVLKELLENAVDAGAKRISVEWNGAGRERIRVTDDGCGMTPEDARLALERHATSKISVFDDLEKIGTFGFRGEALPSIAAVSRFQLITRPTGAKEGWSIAMEGGKVLREGPAGAPAGTTVLVEDLFFSTPARRKFLKSDATEKGLLFRTLEDLALSSRGIHFQVSSEKKDVLSLHPSRENIPPVEGLLERLQSLWGKDRLGALKPVSQSGRFMNVWGWVSDIHSHQAGARTQRLLINNRPVVHRRITHALYEAYRGSLPSGRHPLAVLFLEVDPSLVDVNVHPAKREIRLSHEEEIYGFILQSLRSALSGG